jgi:hypothetical protein
MRDDGGVVACAKLGEYGASRNAGCGRLARQYIIEPPAYVLLPHVPPGRPPREKLIVGGIQGPPDIDHPSTGEHTLKKLPLVGPLTDGIGLAFLGMNILVGPGDVHVAAEN